MKTDGIERKLDRTTGGDEDGHFEERRNSFYKDVVMGIDADVVMEGVM